MRKKTVLVRLLSCKAQVDCLISSITEEMCTMLYCCFPYLLSWVILKVMIDFVDDTTVMGQALPAYAVTAKLHAVRQTMLTMIGTTYYQKKCKV